MKVLALLLSLSLLVVTHELGHYFFARLFKVRVNRFYVFFNWKFSILKAKRFDGKWHFLFFNATTPDEWLEKEPDNTLWGLGWIPLGGYCDIAGMIDETKSENDLASEPQPWEYRTKPAWQRLCIISGGVLVNFLTALLLYTCIFAHWGYDELPMRNATLGYNYAQPLLDDGFRNGDIIYAIDGVEMTQIDKTAECLLLDNPKVVKVLRREKVADSVMVSDSVVSVVRRDTSYFVDIALGGSVIERLDKMNPEALMVLRNPFVVKDFIAGSAAKDAGMMIGDSVVRVAGADVECYSDIKPILDEHKGEEIMVGFYRQGILDSALVHLSSQGTMGVQLVEPKNNFEAIHIDYTFLQAIPAGIGHGVKELTSYVRSLKVLFTKDGAQNLGGFGTLGSLFPKQWDWYQFWWITALLAVILAFMNIIPIPGLDGGYVLFTLWEIITRRKPSDKFIGVANTIGMILLLMLLVVANGNDLLRIFNH